MKKKVPVYTIAAFQAHESNEDFYANTFKEHVKTHRFTHLPHKHDFYLIVLFTKGYGRHEVDFVSYPVEPGKMFLLKPGQMHFWELSDDVDGYIFFHTREFYDSGFQTISVKDFPFFATFQTPPLINLSPKSFAMIREIMSQLVLEHQSDDLLKNRMIRSYVSIVYVQLVREYKPLEFQKNETYLKTVLKFEDLIEDNFLSFRSSKDYAQLLHITEKHLNRCTQVCLNKTSSSLINERTILEAKRKLIYSSFNVSQIGEELGFHDSSYFIRFFRKATGLTPLAFQKKYH